MLPMTRRKQTYSRRSVARIVLLLLLTVGGLAVLPMHNAVAQALPPATFKSVECFVPAPSGYDIDCGYVLAPQSHDNFDGDFIELATVIVRSRNPEPAPDPVVFLSGGPGASATRLATSAPLIFERVLANRDVVFFDHRGTGYSRPNLSCPPLQPNGVRTMHPFTTLASSDLPAFLQQQVDGYVECGKHYQRAGIDLTTYNSVENAADIEDIRRALGYTQLNLFGGSYGTRLALEAMRFRPATIRSAVLEAVVPQPYNWQVEGPASFNRSLTQLFASCSAESACGAAYPHLLERWDQLVAELNAKPLQLPILDVESGETIDYVPFNGWDLTQTVFSLAYVTEALPLLPAVVWETSIGNYDLLSAVVSPQFQGSGENEQSQRYFAQAMQLAVQCFDDMPFVSAKDFISARHRNLRAQPLSMYVEFNEAYKDICAHLGLGNNTPAFLNQPVTSDVPAFLIAGELDPVAPPEQAFAAAATLAHSTVVVYPRGGHGVSASSPCLIDAIAGFVENPAATPNTTCIAAEAPLPFVVRPQVEAARKQLTTASDRIHYFP